LLTALLLLFAAFGIPGSSFVALRTAPAIVCAIGHQPSRPHRTTKPQASAPAPRIASLKPAPLLERPRDLFVRGPLFQRPPPSLS